MKLISQLSKATGFIFVVTALLLFTSSTSLAQTQGRAPVGQARKLPRWFKSDDFRIQFSFKYNFSKTFTY